MVSDGIGTLIGSFLGSPFGTVVYIGHPVHKRVGARTGYSVMNGFIYLILCLTGVLPVILSIIPAVAIGPIIFIFGLMICEGTSFRLLNQAVYSRFFSYHLSPILFLICRVHCAYCPTPPLGNLLWSFLRFDRLHLHCVRW